MAARSDQNLMFAGHSAFRFKSDPLTRNGFVPTARQLVERIQTGYWFECYQTSLKPTVPPWAS